MAYNRKRTYRRRLRSYRQVRRYNSNRHYKKTKNSLSYKVYNLTRKVNRYISTYKPEIQQVRGNMINEDFKIDGALNPRFNNYRSFYEGVLGVYRENNHFLDIKNDLCRSYKLRLFGYFGLCPVDHYYYHVPDVEDYYTNDPYPHTCYLKIVIATLKKGGGRVPTTNELFVTNQPEPSIPGFSDLALITGPLAKNITSQLNILRTKVVKVDAQTPQKLFKINLRVPHYRKRVNDAAYGAGEILVYYQLLCPTYLGNIQNPHAPDPRFVMDYQLMYVDQN